MSLASPDEVFFLIMNKYIYIFKGILKLDHCGAGIALHTAKKNIRSWGMGVNKCHWQRGRIPDLGCLILDA